MKELLDKINQRMQSYDMEYECINKVDPGALTQEYVSNELDNSIAYYWPHSVYAVLCGMYWTLYHPLCDSDEYEWSMEFDTLVRRLDVQNLLSEDIYSQWKNQHQSYRISKWRNEHIYSPDPSVAWLAEVTGWKIEDMQLILEWLACVEKWEYVLSNYDDGEISRSIGFWSSLKNASMLS
jgi:hypothetical protein